MATVTRTFELSEEAAEELDRYAQREGRAPGHCVEDMLMMLHTVTEKDFTLEEWKMIQEVKQWRTQGTSLRKRS